MIKKEICSLKNKLNDLIINGASYEEIYKASQELDLLIVEYYKSL